MRPIDATVYSDHLAWMLKYGSYQTNADALLDAQFRLTKMPTITIDDLRPKGRWVKKPLIVLGCVLRYDTVCSECGFDAPEFADGGGSTVLTKFCHNCGAKMENGEW